MVTLRKITADNLWDIVALKVGESQRTFVADNTRSLLEAYVAITNGGTALPFGIYAGEVPVGFLMIGYGCADWPDAPAIAHDSYSLWRLMIDEKYQGQGYGKAALTAALRYIRTLPCGPDTHCWFRYEPENTVAKKLYASFGFAETGDWDDNEIIAALPL